jgi:hypothetical protein
VDVASGGKERLGSISKAGNRYLRQMLVVAGAGAGKAMAISYFAWPVLHKRHIISAPGQNKTWSRGEAADRAAELAKKFSEGEK